MTTPKKTKAEILAEMKADAELARKEFDEMVKSRDMLKSDNFSLTNVSAWWERWYLKAGHKRLAYILMGKKMKDE